jgi:hypothetical protein
MRATVFGLWLLLWVTIPIGELAAQNTAPADPAAPEKVAAPGAVGANAAAGRQPANGTALATLTLTVVPTKGNQTKDFDATCTIVANTATPAGTLLILPPMGFTAETQTQSVPALAAKQTIVRRSRLAPSSARPAFGARIVSAELSTVGTSTAAPSLIAGASQTFEFDDHCDTTGTYLFYGVLGVILGYVVRYLVNLLKSNTPQQQARAFDLEPTRIERFYPWIDGAVTVVLGFLVLASFIKEGRPPEQGCSWYGAMLAGVALGFLTNSDLMTKLPIPTRLGRLRIDFRQS